MPGRTPSLPFECFFRHRHSHDLPTGTKRLPSSGNANNVEANAPASGLCTPWYCSRRRAFAVPHPCLRMQATAQAHLSGLGDRLRAPLSR